MPDTDADTGLTHSDYPHEPGRLYGCPACEARCHCTGNRADAECIWEGDDHRFDHGVLDTLADQIQTFDFETVFQLTPAGVLNMLPAWHAPEVFHDEKKDVEIADMPGRRWTALTGMTGQHAYNGAVMHSSEFIGCGIADRLQQEAADETQTFTVVPVEVHDEPDDPAGWAILRYVGE